LEGKSDEGDVRTKGLPTPAKYNAQETQDDAMLTTPKTYNADADAVDTGSKKKKKKDKKRKAEDTPASDKKSKKEKKDKKKSKK
jgi:hypothetical protein